MCTLFFSFYLLSVYLRVCIYLSMDMWICASISKQGYCYPSVNDGHQWQTDTLSLHLYTTFFHMHSFTDNFVSLHDCVYVYVICSMHVCMYTCIHVCMYACVHVCMYACMHVCMYACMHVCMYACMHVCIYACMRVFRVFRRHQPRPLVFSDHRIAGQECRNEIVAVQVDGDAESGENNRVVLLLCHLSISSLLL